MKLAGKGDKSSPMGRYNLTRAYGKTKYTGRSQDQYPTLL